MKKYLILSAYTLVGLTAYGCPVCERNKPEVLRGITHGTGPGSYLDYVAVSVISIIAALTLFYSVKWLIKPGESNKDHIKYTFLND